MVTVLRHRYKGSGELNILSKMVAEGGDGSIELTQHVPVPSAQFPPIASRHVQGLPARAHRPPVGPSSGIIMHNERVLHMALS